MKKREVKNNLFLSIKLLIEEAKQKVVRNVNSIIVYTHFEIGKIIIKNEQKGKKRAQYAKKTLIQLSTALTNEYGNGYSRSNLEYTRKFYLLYKNRISQPVVGELPGSFQLCWSHYIQLLTIEDENERNFYEVGAAREAYLYSLEHSIENVCNFSFCG